MNGFTTGEVAEVGRTLARGGSQQQGVHHVPTQVVRRSTSTSMRNQNKWHSPECLKTFMGLLSIDDMDEIETAGADQEIVVKGRLRDELKKVRMGWLSVDGYKQVVDHDTEDLTREDIYLIQCRCKYLSFFFDNVLKDYLTKSWKDLCKDTIAVVEFFQMSSEMVEDDTNKIAHRILTEKTLSKLARNYFKGNNFLPNPAYLREGRRKLPPLLDDNPDFKDAFIQFCDNNLDDLSGAKACNYLRHVALPQLLET